ncbi:MAG: RagB/SusD protein [Gemmatimonadetes bacterium]|nr:RagB/SusD protein [Gemmatimonadota bacterium]
MTFPMIRRLLAPLAVLCLGGAAGCVDLKENPITGITSAYYATPVGFDAAVNSMYYPMKTYWALEKGSTMTVFGTDEFQKGADGGYKFFNDYTSGLNGDVDFIKNTWRDFYQGVNAANTVIDAAKTVNVPDATKALRVGEARFMRALYYFNLARTYGDVPLFIEPTAGVLTETNRDPVAKVYAQVIADLLAAEQALPDKAAQYGRADRPAAQHLLAEVYLTRAAPGDFALAAAKAKAVVDNPRFKLLNSYRENFDFGNEVNSEVVWAVQYTNDPLTNGADSVGNKLHLYFGYPYDLEIGMTRDIANDRPFKRFRPTTWLLNLWDRTKDSRYEQMFKNVWFVNFPNDSRIPKDASGKPRLIAGDTSVWFPGREVTAAERASHAYTIYAPSQYGDAIFPVLNKFLDPSRTATNQESGQRDFPMMRLSNTYLMLAEALMRDGKPDQALPYVNAIRTRAAKPGQTAAMQVTTADLNLDFILDERARELTGECTRWYDLTRTGKLVERVKLYNPGGAPTVQAFHNLRPIPNNEILLSTGTMKQNPGY